MMDKPNVGRELIRRVFLGHGFTVKAGETDLKEYVYQAAEALLREFSQAQTLAANVGRVAVPDGYALVPIKPTREMIDAMPPVEEDGYWAMYEAAIAAAPKVATPTDAMADIAAERRRQMEVEGWTPEHDDAHSDGQMALAAASYAMRAHQPDRLKRPAAPMYWPWDYSWWKPTTPRRDLIKAGALIVAEIERIDRAVLSTRPETTAKPHCPPCHGNCNQGRHCSAHKGGAA